MRRWKRRAPGLSAGIQIRIARVPGTPLKLHRCSQAALSVKPTDQGLADHKTTLISISQPHSTAAIG